VSGGTVLAEGLAGTVTDGPLVAALGVAVLAGLASFLSPCVLPLVPGYVSYVTGLAGADLDAAVGSDPSGRPVPAPDGGTGPAVALRQREVRRRVRGRVLAGTSLFVLGFSVVFVAMGAAAGGLGRLLVQHAPVLSRVAGALVVVMGLAFLGLVPGLQREARLRRLPASGLAGAPLLGAVFALGWTPCLGPTLAAISGLAYVQGGALRGALLSAAYSLGLGVPFVLAGLGLRRLLGAVAVVRRHAVWVTRAGGVLLVVVGLLLVTGTWDTLVLELRARVGVGELWF